jgi:hypothetical protein
MDSETTAIITLLALGSFGGAYITSLFCRRAKSARLYQAIIGTIAAGFLASLFAWFGLSLTHGEFGKGVPVWWLVLLAFVWACGCASIPAV